MPLFDVILRRQITQEAKCTIEAESKEDLDNRLKEVYDSIDEDNLSWEDDDMEAPEGGFHYIEGESSQEPDYVLDPLNREREVDLLDQLDQPLPPDDDCDD